MTKFYYSLKIVFKNDSKTLLYSGKSFYNKSSSVDMTITENEIHIVFSRSKKFPKENLFDTPNSQIRYHLQKVLCFYLATVGSIPEVESMTFNTLDKDGENVTVSEEISHKEFSSSWHKCKVKEIIPPEVGGMIFQNGEGYKKFYISLTYFLKSQLSKFVDDSLGWIWSSFNALYGYWYKKEHSEKDGYSDSDAIQFVFSQAGQRSFPLTESVTYIKTLKEDTFWKKLNWYVYAENMKTRQYNRFKEIYCDEMLLNKLLTYFQKKEENVKNTKINPEERKQRNQELYDKVNRRLQKKQISYKDRVLFLVCDYIYLNRNRLFHAGKSYPLFVISKQNETVIKEELLKIMLLTLKDLYPQIPFNPENE